MSDEAADSGNGGDNPLLQGVLLLRPLPVPTPPARVADPVAAAMQAGLPRHGSSTGSDGGGSPAAGCPLSPPSMSLAFSNHAPVSTGGGSLHAHFAPGVSPPHGGGGASPGYGGGGGGGGDGFALSERAMSEFGDPDYQMFLQSLVNDGDDFLFADDEDDDADPTYDPRQERAAAGREAGRGGRGSSDEEEDEESDSERSSASSSSSGSSSDSGSESSSSDGEGSSGSSSDEEEEEEEEDYETIPLQEVEELLRDSGFRSYLTSTQPQPGTNRPATGRVPLVAPSGGGGRQLVPLLPNHPGPRFGLSPGSWQALMHTAVTEDERCRLASQMVRHLQLLVQTGAMLAHEVAASTPPQPPSNALMPPPPPPPLTPAAKEAKAALGEIQAMVKDIHGIRDRAWAYFGFEPGPTGKGAYRDPDGRPPSLIPNQEEEKGGGGGGGRKGAKVAGMGKGKEDGKGGGGGNKGGKKGGHRVWTRGAALRMEGRSKSLMDVPGVAAADDLANHRLIARVAGGQGHEAAAIARGGLDCTAFTMQVLEAFWQGGGIRVVYLAPTEYDRLAPLMLTPPPPPPGSGLTPLPFDAFSPAETRLLIRGLVLAGGDGQWPAIHRIALGGRAPHEIGWYSSTQTAPEIVRWRESAVAALKAAFQRAPLAGAPPPFTPEEDALLWTGHHTAGPRWVHIARAFLPHRLPHDLMMRWRRVQHMAPPTPALLEKAYEERKAQGPTRGRIPALKQVKQSSERAGGGGDGGGGSKEQKPPTPSSSSFSSSSRASSAASGEKPSKGSSKARGKSSSSSSSAKKVSTPKPPSAAAPKRGQKRKAKGGAGGSDMDLGSSDPLGVGANEGTFAFPPGEQSRLGFDAINVDFSMHSLPSPPSPPLPLPPAAGAGAGKGRTTKGGGGAKRKKKGAAGGDESAACAGACAGAGAGVGGKAGGGGGGGAKGGGRKKKGAAAAAAAAAEPLATISDTMLSFPALSPGRTRGGIGGGGEDSFMYGGGGDDHFDMDFTLMGSPGKGEKEASRLPPPLSPPGGAASRSRAAIGGVVNSTTNSMPPPEALGFSRLLSQSRAQSASRAASPTKQQQQQQQQQQQEQQQEIPRRTSPRKKAAAAAASSSSSPAKAPAAFPSKQGGGGSKRPARAAAAAAAAASPFPRKKPAASSSSRRGGGEEEPEFEREEIDSSSDEEEEEGGDGAVAHQRRTTRAAAAAAAARQQGRDEDTEEEEIDSSENDGEEGSEFEREVIASDSEEEDGEDEAVVMPPPGRATRSGKAGAAGGRR